MFVEHLVQSLCDTKLGYTHSGRLRPFGVSFLVTNGPQVVNGQGIIQDKDPKFIQDKIQLVENFNNADNSSKEQEQQDIIAQEPDEYEELKILVPNMHLFTFCAGIKTIFEQVGVVNYVVAFPPGF